MSLITDLSEFLLHFFFSDTAPTEIYTLSLHDALPILTFWWPEPKPTVFVRPSALVWRFGNSSWPILAEAIRASPASPSRSEEHTSELQSHVNLVCRLLLEKKKKQEAFT